MLNTKQLKLITVPKGEYRRGGGDWELRPDAMPVHTVRLTKDTVIAKEPVSYALYLEYARETGIKNPDVREYRGYVIGVSWQDASDFCQWLSEKEGQTYRLPTEAEWEYCARTSKNTGVDRMCDQHLREWCFDWYDRYSAEEQTDPAGSKTGDYKVVRGGYLDNPTRYNAHPLDVWMRCALPRLYRHFPEDVENEFGRHTIGFRVVRGEIPVPQKDYSYSRLTETVKQNRPAGQVSKDTPYFRKRYLLPCPPDNATWEEIQSVGLNPIFRHHHHSPALTALDNGDLLFTAYSTYHEYDAESGLIGARLRYGADCWDLPDVFVNPVGVNDHAPLLFTDTDGTVYFYWGWQQLDNSFPFQYIYSKDNGATWSETVFPLFKGKANRVVRQPINSAIHGKDGTYYVASDSSEGSVSVLWRSTDLIHWEDPIGRTGGRHSTVVQRSDGSLYALGGKNSEIKGYMPQSISYDRGETWDISPSPFPMMTSGQRPSLVKLASGVLVTAGDYQNKQRQKPQAFCDKDGSYIAYSTDEGETWTLKDLPGQQPRKKDGDIFGGGGTVGYSVTCQSPDGMIHLVTSNTHPCLHFSFNEAWLYQPVPEQQPSDSQLLEPEQKQVEQVKTFQEQYPSGAVRCQYAGGQEAGGRFLLHGEERWYYETGELEAVYHYSHGKPVATHTRYHKNGNKDWEWEYYSDNTARHSTYHATGTLRSTAGWRGKMAEGLAQTFREDGSVQSEVWFAKGEIVKRTDLRRETPSPMGEIIEAP